MKKLLLLLFLIPLICSAQQSRNVNIDVVDESGLKIGTMSMRATYTRTYGNGYEVALEKYIQYLKEKESKEIAEKQRNELNQRLKSLGMSPVPSWDTGIYSAALEGYASVKEREARNKGEKSSNLSVNKLSGNVNKYTTLAIVDVLMSGGRRKKVGYNRVASGLQSSYLKIVNPIDDKKKFKENNFYLKNNKNPQWLYLYYEARYMGAEVRVTIRDYRNNIIYKRKVENVSFWKVLKDIASIRF